MNIKFSRHARRRMKLYDISEEIVQNILKRADQENKNIVVEEVSGFAYPLKRGYR